MKKIQSNESKEDPRSQRDVWAWQPWGGAAGWWAGLAGGGMAEFPQ